MLLCVLKAEGENIRRRAQEDISKAHKFAIESFAESLVPVKDSLEMGLKVETQTVESIKEGVEMTLKQLNAAFEKNRLLEVNPQQGDKLDPSKHQAVSMVPAEQEAKHNCDRFTKRLHNCRSLVASSFGYCGAAKVRNLWQKTSNTHKSIKKLRKKP